MLKHLSKLIIRRPKPPKFIVQVQYRRVGSANWFNHGPLTVLAHDHLQAASIVLAGYVVEPGSRLLIWAPQDKRPRAFQPGGDGFWEDTQWMA
jgi:hypothetical protein